MYGRIKQKPLTQTNQPLSCESIRQELYKYIDDEARRVNVDSAKKRAVLQHMDYEGFRQMVLGANLFTVKSSELNKFSGGLLDSNNDTAFNVLATGVKKQIQLPANFEQIVKIQTHVKPEIICNSFNEFKKRFSEYYKLPLQQKAVNSIYQLLKDQNQQRILKIFSSDFDPSYLGKICQVLIYVLQNHVIEQKDINQFLYIYKLMEMIGNIKNIGIFVLKLLSKKEKSALNKVLQILDGSNVKEGELVALRPLFQKYIG